ncbi:MAG: hypothetical protein ACTHMI_10510 [Mucilaginibacter sp.]|uniref:hypothetical protein n=1 Tax=Mucilaginibacter sp. L3T2-6 TaxID=3062491 RepID=UPI0026768F07|nr:hypothetical protein [Mucilaginibacter sp. L3T2-6]MDO3642277.1 hypothetical protein [Mucilaginibacter sp. L3T2-6]MDV6214772.1 hypothetical protein [Mucilaginibacter sp. L3T2-6]
MKKISLSIIAIAMACASVMAVDGPVKHAKKAKQETCTKCKDTKCTKACTEKGSCSEQSDCCAKN